MFHTIVKFLHHRQAAENVPGSCCKGATQATVLNYVGSTKCPAAAGTPINYYEEVSFHEPFLSQQVNLVICLFMYTRQNKKRNT